MNKNELENITTAEGKKIKVIPATRSLHPERDGVEPIRKKKQVAAYCRVSTTLEEQQGSYDLQQKYYEELINNNPDWELAGIYGDEGKSGTTLKGRTGFLEMMDEVRAGRIDYIIAKATSRFGRNNSEFISILDELDSYGVEVFFESEGILTSGKQDRTMLQIMGIANEHYSSTLSSNIRWSKERNMRKGKITISYKTFLGYKKGPDGEPEIVEEEAEVVRLIFDLFLDGKPYSYIANYLTDHNISTPAGKTGWKGNIVKSILTNEKYTGDVLLQKTFTRSYLDKRPRKNNGEVPQVLIEDNHPAIIDKATFARAQELIKMRADRRNSGTAKDPFIGRVICGDCGNNFGHKTWHSRGRIKYAMWVCNHKYAEENAYGGNKCKVANLRQEWLEQGYLYSLNKLLARKRQILGKYGRKLKGIETRLSSGGIEKEMDKKTAELVSIEEQISSLKTEWEFTFGGRMEYEAKMDTLETWFKETRREIKELEQEKDTLNAESKKLHTFLDAIEAMPEEQHKFRGNDFINTIDHVEVGQYVLAYYFYGGECVKVNIELLKKMCAQM